MRASMAEAMAGKAGAPFTIASVMPVSSWMTAGMGSPGFTSVLHSLTRGGPPSASPSTRTIPISVMRSSAARIPVVSVSTKASEGAKSCIGFERVQFLQGVDFANVRSLFYAYVERSFLPCGAAGLLRAPSRTAILRVDRQPAWAEVEVVGGGAGRAHETRRVPRFHA